MEPEPVEIVEGIWEDLVARASELSGRRVRLEIFPPSDDDLLIWYAGRSHRDWFNTPARSLQTCLWNTTLEGLTSTINVRGVDLVFNCHAIGKHHKWPLDRRVIVRLAGAESVRAFQWVHPGPISDLPDAPGHERDRWYQEFNTAHREESMSWTVIEETVAEGTMWVEETLVVPGYADSVMLSLEGLLGSRNTNLYLIGSKMSLELSDGGSITLDELEELGNEAWDAQLPA